MADVEIFWRAYEAALQQFFRHDEEKAFFAASELAKEMIQAGIGPDVLLDIHSTTLRDLVRGKDPAATGRMAMTANDVLLHAVMAYAMNYHSLLSQLEAEKGKLEKAYSEVEEANSRLMELNRLKSVFIASMSHELRTPLNSVIGFSSILLEEWTGPLNPEQKENLAIILRSGKHLLSLINDVIDVSKIESGMVEASMEDFDLFDLISEAVGSVSKEAENKGLVLRVEAAHRELHTDRRRLLQCLLNLLSNALKFTERGEVSLRAGVTPEGDSVEISLTDTGVGIRDEDISRLFQPFCRFDSPVKAPGTGLGLYLTRKLVTEILKGRVTCSSAFGGGSTFVITIPCDTRPEEPVGAERGSGEGHE